MSKQVILADVVARQRAFRAEEGRARLVRRWLAGESEKDIGRLYA
jgi:hypothetical protein